MDGASTKGWDNEMAARHLRGSEGSAVWVEVARHGGSDQIPGMAGDRFDDPEAERKRFRCAPSQTCNDCCFDSLEPRPSILYRAKTFPRGTSCRMSRDSWDKVVAAWVCVSVLSCPFLNGQRFSTSAL